MTDLLRPPPYRKRPVEIVQDEDPAAQDQRLRRELTRAVVAMFVVGGIAFLVFALGALPGGSLAFFLILVATVVVMARRKWKRDLRTLLILLAALALVSLIGIWAMLSSPDGMLQFMRGMPSGHP